MKNDINNLPYAIDLINTLIDTFDDYSFASSNSENTRRFEYARECLRKAYTYVSPIIYRKDYI